MKQVGRQCGGGGGGAADSQFLFLFTQSRTTTNGIVLHVIGVSLPPQPPHLELCLMAHAFNQNIWETETGISMSLQRSVNQPGLQSDFPNSHGYIGKPCLQNK